MGMDKSSGSGVTRDRLQQMNENGNTQKDVDARPSSVETLIRLMEKQPNRMT
jgi:hypothetical protein